jgi:hypothetical protein
MTAPFRQRFPVSVYAARVILWCCGPVPADACRSSQGRQAAVFETWGRIGPPASLRLVGDNCRKV